MSLALIAAIAANGVIGRGGQLPWHLPDDLKRFKALTMGHPIIMGRRTFESIGKPLPGRQNVVVSRAMREHSVPGIDVARSLEDALEFTQRSTSPAFVIGGAALYAAALPRASRLHLTELDEPVDGDTLFPPFDRDAWRIVEETRHDVDDRHAFAFSFRMYERA